MTRKEPSLTDYLQEHPAWKGGTGCATCTLPLGLLTELETYYRTTLPGKRRWKAVVAYLASKDVPLSSAKLQYHFDRAHHER